MIHIRRVRSAEDAKKPVRQTTRTSMTEEWTISYALRCTRRPNSVHHSIIVIYNLCVCAALPRETWNRHASTSSNHHKWSHKLFVRWQRIDERETKKLCATMTANECKHDRPECKWRNSNGKSCNRRLVMHRPCDALCTVCSTSRQSQYRSHWHDSRMWNGLFAHLIRVCALSSYRWPSNWMQMRRVSTDFTFPMQIFRESVIAFEMVESGRLSSAWNVRTAFKLHEITKFDNKIIQINRLDSSERRPNADSNVHWFRLLQFVHCSPCSMHMNLNKFFDRPGWSSLIIISLLRLKGIRLRRHLWQLKRPVIVSLLRSSALLKVAS